MSNPSEKKKQAGKGEEAKRAAERAKWETLRAAREANMIGYPQEHLCSIQ